MEWKRILGRACLSVAAAAAIAGCAGAPASGTPTLSRLDVLVTPGGGGKLTPAFSPGVKAYTLNLAGDTMGFVVAAGVPDEAWTIAVNGVEAKTGAQTVVMTGVGATRVDVAVTAPGGAGAHYTISVVREDLKPVTDRFLKLSFTDPANGVTEGYRLFVPQGYDPSRRYPLVLFLHGAGELGSDNEIQLTANQGATMWARPEEQARHPCFVLAPQSPAGADADPAHYKYGSRGWTSLMKAGFQGGGSLFTPEPELETAYRILMKVMGEYSVDPARVYATGVSMGGFGTFAIGIAHPETFAALVPVCGGGDPAALAAMARMPIWVFHAEEDPAVPVAFSRASVDALKAAGGSPRYTEYPKGTFFFPMAHFSWVPAYADAEMRDWLFTQTR